MRTVRKLSILAPMERRKKPRIEHIPAKLKGVDSEGRAFEVDIVLANLSAGGLYAQLAHSMPVGATLDAVIRLNAMRVSAHGVVRRVEPQPDGVSGLGAAFTRYHVRS